MTEPAPPQVVLHDVLPGGAEGQGRVVGSRVGFSLPVRPWDLSGRGWTCVGVIETEEDAAGAIEALARGVGLSVRVAVQGELRHRLLEDLHRLGTVVPGPASGGPGPPRPSLGPEQQALLEVLAGGATVGEAADALHLSRRTVNRRLGAIRALFGVGSTTEVLARWGSSDGSS